MSDTPEFFHRRSIRLQGYDYCQAGAYFVTVATVDRACLLGEINRGSVILSQTGQIAAQAWKWLALQYPYVELGDWVIMPNHLHGILVIHQDSVADAGRGGSRTAPLPAIATMGGVLPGEGDLGEPGMNGSRTALTAGCTDENKTIGRFDRGV
jgi:putative transposase